MHSKSPNALVTANQPNTQPNTMKPPSFFILSYSSSLVDTLWSHDKVMALPFQLRTALASPMFAQNTQFPMIKQILAVAPHLYAQSPYYQRNKSSHC